MAQTINNYPEFLAEARQAVEELSLLRDREEQLKQRERGAKKSLEAEKKHISDTVQQTVKKRQEEINSSYDKEITKGQERLRKARQKREKAKTQGVSARIEEETEELHSYNAELKGQMKMLFQQNRVPGFCRTGIYYSLYFPRRFREILIFVGWLLISFGIIPCGIYYYMPERQPWNLAVLYVLAVIIFGGSYVLIGNRTKLRYIEALQQGRSIRNIIQSNKKKIRVITTAIRRDRDDARYNLEKYDDDIARIEQELQEITGKKKEALNTFEQVTKLIISDEIEGNGRDKVEALQTEYDEITSSLNEVEVQIKEKSLEITDKYEPYLGREFLEALKISELSALIQDGSASNLTEAIAVYRENKK